MQTMSSLWERALSQLLGLTGRMLSIEISAIDGWAVGSFGGVLEHVAVVTMGGSGGEDARLQLGGPFANRVYLSENDLVALDATDHEVALTTRDVIVRLSVL